MKFRSTWCSVSLPSHWRGRVDSECAGFWNGDFPIGILHVSSARRDIGIVTDQDVLDFAQRNCAREFQLTLAEFDFFSGFTASDLSDGTFWREWWLWSGRLLVYATYNVDQRRYEASEAETVACILRSLVETNASA